MIEKELTPEQVAERLQIHVATIRRLLRDGRLIGYKPVGVKDWRVQESDLEKYIEGAKEAAQRDIKERQRRKPPRSESGGEPGPSSQSSKAGD